MTVGAGGDRTKSGQSLGPDFDENVAHLPVSGYANTILNGGAVKSTENQMAGPRSTFMIDVPDGQSKVDNGFSGESKRSNTRWK